jgi:lysophospholipid acyltransferase (LPLAT)-like uncharacterized protein
VTILGVLLGIVARLWLWTLRVELEVHPALSAFEDRPWVLAFFHGKQWPLLAWRRRRPTAVMVSLSRDGELQAGALGVLGFTVTRGSSSRGGARGLAALVRLLRGARHDAAFAVDGPRGPYGVPKPGVALAARRANAVIVPMGSAVASGKVLGRAWDRFTVAWPFTRVGVALGAPLEPRGARPEEGELEAVAAAIERANGAAERILAVPGARMVRFH